VLVPGTGHFSDSWAEQVAGVRRHARADAVPRGFPIDPAAVEAALRDDAAHRIGAVFVVQTDTASGTTCDLAAIRAAIDAARHPALFVVDVVASLAAAPFAMDALGVDVVDRRIAEGPDGPPGPGVRRRQRTRARVRPRQPDAALLLGLGAAAQRRSRTASSAGRRRSPTWPASRPRSA
jgi:alanine-glyoxylate transaminase/serine-glyoxylate transaminase/serine-pyruvate transaminase